MITCRTNGIECMVGSDLNFRDKSPPIGSVITVKHSGSYKSGALRHPFYWRQRSDIQWDTISSMNNRELVRKF